MNTRNNTSLYLLIVDDIHPVFMDIVRAAGIQCDYKPSITRNECLAVLGNYTGLILRSKFKVDTEIIDAGKNLKIIGRAGAGIDNIDQSYAEKKGINLFSAPEGNCDAVGEHMMAMLLSLLNKLTIGNFEVRNGLWLREENRGMELGGKTIALIGYGNNGHAMAKKLSGFDVNVIAYDKYKTGFSNAFVEEVQMDEIFLKADILSLHIPLTAETYNLVNKEFIAQFAKSIYLLNGSRGEIVNITDLSEAIEMNKIRGAALDVLPIEKFPNLNDTDWYKKLISFNNVILSPHVAGWSVESYFKLSKILADKIVGYQLANKAI